MLIIFDLDGTILSVNSFRVWTLFMMRGRFSHMNILGRLAVTGGAVAAVAARKARLISHDRLKHYMQRLWQRAVRGDAGASEQRLAEELMAFVRPELVGILAAVAAGKVEAVMATAAAGDYAYCLGRRLGFKHILATPPVCDVAREENIGERKAAGVLKLIKERGWGRYTRVLFTDHRDDLPLARICHAVYWFGPAAERFAVERAAPGVRFAAGCDGARDVGRAAGLFPVEYQVGA